MGRRPFFEGEEVMYIKSERFIITELTLDMCNDYQKNSVDDDNRRFVCWSKTYFNKYLLNFNKKVLTFMKTGAILCLCKSKRNGK